ncbi:MAG: efflux RND transporter periplasmic adaptor subunit [Gammaproteobacteria bacterium]|nr:efflux RND transporter periplasmic adaptor subunit [Gammaproteobacteria bacterium]
MLNEIRSLLVAIVCLPLWPGLVAAQTTSGTTLDCIVEPSAIVDLGSAAPGVLASIPFDRADLVEAGQVVAELDSDVERATMELARARADLNTTLELRRVNALFGERQQTRHRDLVARNLVPEQDYDRIETEARIAELQAREAQDEKKLAYLDFKRAEAALERRVIRSPISGIVIERFKSEGEYVEDQPVLRVAKIDTLHVEVLAPVEMLGKVHEGMNADIALQPESLGSRTATVTRVDKVADAASGTFGIRLELKNEDHALPGGLRCMATFSEDAGLPVAVR